MKKHKADDPSRAGNSKYAKKQRAKHSRCPVPSRWMSWFENPQKPRARVA